MRIRHALVGIAAMACLGIIAPGANAAPKPKPGPEPAVPTQCGVGMLGAGKKGPFWVSYENGRVSVEQYTESRWPWIPVAMQNYGGLGGEDYAAGSYRAVAPNGSLYNVEREMFRQPNGSWTSTATFTVLQSGWRDTVDLVQAYPFLYQQTATGLVRHEAHHVEGQGYPLGAAETVPGTWNDLVDMVHVGSTAINGSTTDNAAVFYAVRKDGSLDKVVIGNAPGSVPIVTTLKTTGFGAVTELARSWCSADPNGLVLLGVTARGEAYVWYDKDITNSSGADLTGGSRPVAKGWKDTLYGQ